MAVGALPGATRPDCAHAAEEPDPSPVMNRSSRWCSSPGPTASLCKALFAGSVLTAALAAQAPPTFSIVNDRPGTFHDISATGTLLVKYPDTWTPNPNDVTLLAPDDWSIPFISGVTNALVTTPDLIASTNGAIGSNTFGQYFDGSPLPSYSQWLGLFPLWEDLVVDEQATMVHQLINENGIDVEIVQWTNVRTYADWVANAGTRGTFQVKIFASGPVMAQFLYQDVAFEGGGAQAIIGAQWDYYSAAQHSAYQPNAVAAGTVLSVIRWQGVVPEFTATPTGGPTPLLVQFTDQSISSEATGVTSWAWDFNGDSVIDSTDQNPTWTYTSCGTYSVTLTVNDGVNSPGTVTKSDLIVTDIIAANFSWQALGGNAVRFTDTSSPPATVWAWDFDGDSIIDSTEQNPTWTYAASGVHNARLTARRLCGPEASISKQAVSFEQGVATTLDGGHWSDATFGTDRPGSFFDITVMNPIGINVTGVAMSFVNQYYYGSVPVTVDMYLTGAPGGYIANWTNKTNWRKVATGRGIVGSEALYTPSLVNLTFDHPIWIAPGTQGMALVVRRLTVGQVAISSTAGFGTYGNSDVSLAMGGVNTSTTGFGTAGRNNGQVWNGVLFYDLRGGPDDITAPTPNAGPDRLIIHANTLVALNGSGSTDETSDTNSLGYQWSLVARPVGSISTILNPKLGPTGASIRPDVWGVYRISLVVTDEQGNVSAPDEMVITVPEDAVQPVANAGPDLSVHPGVNTPLNASGSNDNVTGAAALVYLWTVVAKPTGSTVNISGSGGNFTVRVNMMGDYRLRLIVRDEQRNLSQPDEVMLSTYNQAPTANAGVDQIVLVNSWAYINGYGSFDPDNDNLLFEWSVASAPSGSNASFYYGGQSYYDYFVPDVRGTYVLSLVVHDPWGGYSSPDTVTIVAILPAEMAAMRCKEASDLIQGYAAISFDAPGHQYSMCSQLSSLAKKLITFVDHELARANNPANSDAEEAAQERQDLLINVDHLIERVDGYPNRSQVDPKGQGQLFAADFIVSYWEQYQVFWKLMEARNLIQQ